MAKVSNKKIKVLTITPGLNVCGGIESYAMNYYLRINNSVKMDFITHDISDNYYKNLIEKNGDKVYLFPKIGLKNYKEVINKVDDFFKEHHDYNIVHCHMANAAFLYLKVAKKYGIKVRILHSHQNKAADILSHAIRNVFLIRFGLKYANVNFACSKLAGDYLFKNKKYYIIKNAIDTDRFKFNNEVRNKYRKDLKLNDYFVIGNVGRFCAQKNQLFLIDVFNNVNSKIKSKLLLIGSGSLKEKIEEKINELGLNENVIILQPKSDIENYYQAMDMFILPSIYEGLGIVNVEAQCTGLQTVVSDRIPKDAGICDLIHYVSLNSSIDEWSNVIIDNMKYKRKSHIKDARSCGYDITKESLKLINLYKKIIKDCK